MGILNQIVVNSLYRFIFILFQLLVTIFVSRLIGPDGLGVYSLLLANANVILIFTSLGIPSGIIFHEAKKDLTRNSLWRIAFISALAQFILIGHSRIYSLAVAGKFSDLAFRGANQRRTWIIVFLFPFDHGAVCCILHRKQQAKMV
jgi:O-antigen/teichoic acid export membrane protein